jgi:Domain of unknown function (DUF4062)
MSKKYQIFVSSTYLDLIEEREQVLKACLEMGHIPVGMEMFSAADEEQWKTIQRQIDEIDYYVILVAHRYGTTTKEGISYTEKEYDYAVLKGIPILGFVIDDNALWPANKIDKEENVKISLTNFKDKVRSRLVNFWSNKDELHAKFSISLMKAIVNNPRSGWVKAEDSIGPDVMKELSRLSSENSSLRKENEFLKEVKAIGEDENKKTIEILSKNKRKVRIWHTDDKSWNEREPFEVSLLQIFQAVAPNLINENHNSNIANNIALELSNGNSYRKEWPVPSNHISEYIADFHALELVDASKKKHPVSDTKEYWTLTKKGRDVINSVRKLRLMAGIYEKEEEPDRE